MVALMVATLRGCSEDAGYAGFFAGSTGFGREGSVPGLQ
jgi:hypothetical protein